MRHMSREMAGIMVYVQLAYLKPGICDYRVCSRARRVLVFDRLQ